MIELRWLERWVEHQGVGESPKYVEERVLQYREGSYPYQAPHNKEWAGSDWQDVPTVWEE